MKKTVLRHGAFLAPYHGLDESPTLALRRDLELAEWLDQLGFDEIWFGEHHSSGFETIASPELMIAAAAEVTKRIRLGTGVVSLPYHNPLMLVNRVIQLDHMTMGRMMFGIGPGLLPTDASMLGIDVSAQRDMMVEAIGVILRLLRGEEVTATGSWFTLDRARAHILPYSSPYPEIAVASAVTPSGGMLAGKFDFGMLCVAATQEGAFDVLGTNWQAANQVAAEDGRVMDPSRLRLVGPMHIAETREKARENVKFGLQKWCNYYDRVAPKGLAGLTGGDPLELLLAKGRAVIGTPADAIAQIERLQAKQGDFGFYLQQATNWADWDATRKSYELYARYVMPHFTRTNANRQASYDSLAQAMESLNAQRESGVKKAFRKWDEKRQGA